MPDPSENKNMMLSEFKNILGRDPSAAEAQFFTQMLSSGYITPFEIGEVLKGFPESQRATLGRDMAEVGRQYEALDTDVLGRTADVARSQYARLGRPDTSAIPATIASAGRDLALDRKNALAAFYGQGISGIREQEASRGLGSLARAYQLGDESRQFNRDLDLAKYWYNRQQNDFNSYLNAQKRRQRAGAIGSIGLGLLGAGLGGSGGGGVRGAMLGANLGSSIGGQFENF